MLIGSGISLKLSEKELSKKKKSVSLCVQVHSWHKAHVGVRGYISGVGSPLPQCWGRISCLCRASGHHCGSTEITEEEMCVHHHIWLFYTGFGIKLKVLASWHCLSLAVSPMSLTSFFKADYELGFCRFSNHYLWCVPKVSGEQSMWNYGEGRASFLKTTVITSPGTPSSGEPGAQVCLCPTPTHHPSLIPYHCLG